MALSKRPLTLIVAATAKYGIGKDGALPWPMLRKEMAYFARVTKRVPSSVGSANIDGYTSRNIVIMGRKTWDSIPPKFRPLKDRTNIVITRQPAASFTDLPNDVVIATSIEDGINRLEQQISAGTNMPAGRAFVIGGSSIYAAALELPQAKHILLTKIQREYDCDTYFPAHLEDASGAARPEWQRASNEELSQFVGEDIPQGTVKEGAADEAVEYEFCLYQRS